jgi:hypothetical protein
MEKGEVAEAYMSRGLIHRGQKDYDLALRDFTTAASMQGYDAMHAWLHKGFQEFMMGHLVDSQRSLSAAVDAALPNVRAVVVQLPLPL